MTGQSAFERECESCGLAFMVPVAEQQFRQARNLPEPVVCPECRLRDRNRRNAELLSLHDQGIGNGALERNERGARGSGRRHSTSGRSPEGSSQRFNTVCAQCGAETQVPFVPRGDRPVYCRDCYNARRGR